MIASLERLDDAVFEFVRCSESAAHDLAGPMQKQERQDARSEYFAAIQEAEADLTAAQQHERLLGEALRSTLVKVGVLSPDAAVSGPELLLAAHEYATLASTEPTERMG